MRHKLKTISPYFEAVVSGDKTFEVRRNDRSFQKGDILELHHWLPTPERFTGDKTEVEVAYVFSNGDLQPLKEGFVVLGIKPVKVEGS